MLVQGLTNMEYRLTNEDLACLKQCHDRSETEYNQYHDQLVKERFNGNSDDMANEIYHRMTGKLIFNKRQTQRLD